MVEVLLLPPRDDVENDGETVHLIGTPPLVVPEHPEEYAILQPEGPDSLTLYLPLFNVIEVQLDDPEKDFGEGLLPDTVMVKSEGFFVPPLVLSTLVVTLRNVDELIGDVGFFIELPPPFDVEDDEDEVAFFEATYPG